MTAGVDGTARIWDAATGQELLQLRGHTGTVFWAAYSPDGKTIVTGGQDQTARVWDAATGEQLRQLTGHTGYVRSAAYSPDGKTVVTGSRDRTARIWVVSLDDLLTKAQRLIQRDPPIFTPDERQRYGLN